MKKLFYSLLLSLFVMSGAGAQTISLIDSLNWTDNLGYPGACQLGSSEFYAVTYGGASTSIYLAIAELDETDASWVQNTDEVLVGTRGSDYSYIIQLGTSAYYAVFYGDGDDYGTVKTYQLNESTGAITALVDSMRWCVTDVIGHPTPLRVAGDVYLVTYNHGGSAAQGSPTGDCWVMTLTLDDADGSCDGVIDSLEVDGRNYSRWADTIYIGNDWYLTASDHYEDNLFSYQVTSGGAIDAAVTDNEDYTLDNSAHQFQELENLGTNYFAWCSKWTPDATDDVTIRSGSVNTTTGDISVPIDDLLITTSGDQPHMVWIDEKWMVLAYRIDDGSNDGYVVTVDVSATGVIAAAVEDGMEYDQTYAIAPFVLALGDLPAFSIWYYGGVGEVKSFGITGTDLLFQGTDQYIALINHGGSSEGTLYTFSCQTTGIISDAAVDSYQFEADIESGVTEHVDMARIGSTEYYALVWVDEDADGMLGTIQISSAGDIADGGLTDSYEMDATAVGYPRILQCGTSNYFLVTYASSDASTWFKTYSISDAGDITIHAVDSLNITTIDWLGYTIPVGGDRYICYGTGAGSDGFYATFYVNPTTGAVSDAAEAAAEWHPWNWYGSGRGCRIPGTKYHTTASRGQINNFYTQEVDTTDGSVDSTPASDMFSIADDWQVIKPLSVGGDSVYAMAYSEVTTDDGWLRTFVIHPSDGTVPNFHACLDSVEFETTSGEHFDILETSTAGLIVVSSSGLNADGYVRSFMIAGNGTITGPLEVFEYDSEFSGGSRMIELTAAAGWGGIQNGVSNPANINGVTPIANRNGVE